jgi:hypothetical protein
MKKVVAYCGFNFSNNSAYLRMPEAFWSQTDAQQLEIVNQLIDELTKEKEHLESICRPDAKDVISD